MPVSPMQMSTFTRLTVSTGFNTAFYPALTRCPPHPEAFASQAAYTVKKLGIDPRKVNPVGGSIALGEARFYKSRLFLVKR